MDGLEYHMIRTLLEEKWKDQRATMLYFEHQLSLPAMFRMRSQQTNLPYDNFEIRDKLRIIGPVEMRLKNCIDSFDKLYKTHNDEPPSI